MFRNLQLSIGKLNLYEELKDFGKIYKYSLLNDNAYSSYITKCLYYSLLGACVFINLRFNVYFRCGIFC